MDLFTRRALTPVMAARRQVTLDTTPTKKATRRWATLRAAKAPDLNLSGLTTLTLTLSWSSLSKWKKKRCWAIPSVTPPLMLPSSAAPQRGLIWPCTHPKQLTPDNSQPGSVSPTAEVWPLLPRLFLEAQGKPAATMMEMCFCFGSTSGLCMNVC